jgi:hypothetical protein
MPKVDNLDITLPDIGDVTGIAGKRLQDLDEGLELFHLQFENEHAFRLGARGKLALSASTGAAYDVEVFNDEDDDDADLVWNAGDGGGRDDEPIWDHGRAAVAVKHQVVATVGAAAAPKLPLPGGFSGKIGIAADTRIKLINYKGHAGGEDAVAALKSDVRRLHLPVVYAHVKKAVTTPGNYEVMVYKVLGTFGLGVELSWGEILSLNSIDVSTPLGAPDTLGFAVSGMAKVGFDVSLTSELELVVSPADAGFANLRFRKCRRSELGFKGKLGLAVEPRNADRLIASIDELIAEATGFPKEKLDELLERLKQRVGFDELPAPLQEIAAVLEERLDVAYDELLDGWTAEVTRYTARLQQLARRKVEAAMAFEYARISTDEALLDVDLRVDDAAAARTYEGLLVGDFETVMLHADAPWVRVNDFLRRKETVSTFAYGLGLSWGDKKLVGNRTAHRFKESVQRNRRGHRLIGWVSILTGSDYGIGVSSAPEITFTAAMERFKKTPHARDFRFSFNFSWVHAQKDLSEAERFEMVDLAALFGAIQPHWRSNERLLREVADFAARGVTFTVNLSVAHDGILAMLARDQEEMKDAFIDGLAAGVYYWHDGEWRHGFATRKCLYRGSMERAVRHEAETFPAIGTVCDGFTYDVAARRFDSAELDFGRGFHRLREETIEALPTRIRPFFKSWGRWKQALGEADADRSVRQLRKAIRGIDDCFSTPLRQRALGHMLVTLLADRPEALSATASFVHDDSGDALSYRRNR